jgi:hypothetical protein
MESSSLQELEQIPGLCSVRTVRIIKVSEVLRILCYIYSRVER